MKKNFLSGYSVKFSFRDINLILKKKKIEKCNYLQKAQKSRYATIVD